VRISAPRLLLIRRLPLVTDVSPECLQEIVNNLILVRISAGEHIMRAGEVGDSMYFINQGHVSVRVD
jgi:CRP-like cAMP-binding protein